MKTRIIILAGAMAAALTLGCGGDSTPADLDGSADAIAHSDTGVGSDAGDGGNATDGAVAMETGSDALANGETSPPGDAADTGPGSDAADGACQEFSAFVLDLVSNHTNGTEQPVPTEGRCFTDSRNPAAFNALFP